MIAERGEGARMATGNAHVAGTTLRLDLLAQPLALLRLPASSMVPEWVAGARHFLSVTRTPTEVSIVADAGVVPRDVAADRAYRAFRVQGPLPLHLVGVLAALAVPLAEAGVPIFPIATYDTDYLLVNETDVPRARAALIRAGHEVVMPDPAGQADAGDRLETPSSGSARDTPAAG